MMVDKIIRAFDALLDVLMWALLAFLVLFCAGGIYWLASKAFLWFVDGSVPGN